MLNTNFIEFNIDIQEIQGKHVVETLLEDVVDKCKELNIICNIDILTNKLMVGGGDSTFPFNLFEKAADKITILKEVKEQKSKSIFDRLFSFDTTKNYATNDTPVINEPEPEPEPEPVIDLSYKQKLSDSTEIIHIKIKLFDKTIDTNLCGGSIHELEQWFRNKKLGNQ